MLIRRWLILLGLIVLVSCAEDVELVAPDVTLTASAVVIEQGESVTLSWEVLGTEPVEVVLEPPQNLPLTSPLTVTPLETTTYTLTATNAAGSDSSSVTVNVNVPEPPVPDPTPARIETLTGEVMSTALGITLNWSLGGEAATSCMVDIGDGSTPRTIADCRTVTQVSHTYTQAGTYTITLTLDSGLSQSLTVVIDEVTSPPTNRAPVVSAGADVDARVGEVVSLTGQVSDEDGDDLSFIWEVVDKPDTSSIELTDDDSLTATFTADVAGVYSLRLTVSDGTVAVTDELTVQVLAASDEVINSVRFVEETVLELTEGTSQTVQLERWGTTRDRLIVRVQLVTPDPTSTEDIVLDGANLVDGVYRVVFEDLRSRTAVTLRAPEDDLDEGLEQARLVILENDAYNLVTPSELAITINDADLTPQPPIPNLRVCQGDIVASSQADVETLRGCTSVTGSLAINPLDTSTLSGQHSSQQGGAITSLVPLSDLEYVAGGLTIANTDVTSLEGLDNLALLESDRFASTLALINNDALVSLQGLNPELRLENNLLIQDNDVLVNLQGLEAISVLVNLEIEDNPALQSLQGLGNLEVVRAALQIRNNPQLITMAGLDNLREVDGALVISDNAALTNLTGLDNLRSVDSSISIYQNDALTALLGLNNMTLVGGTLSVEGNPRLMSLTGLDALRSIGIIRIEDNDQLVSLAGMLNLRDMGGSLTVADNDALTSLAGLEMLRTAASLDIRNNALLTSLTGLETLQTLAGLGIQDNASLQSLQGLTSLSRVDGLVAIINNDSLRSLAGVDALVSIGPDIESRRVPSKATSKATSQTRLGIPPIGIDPPPAGSYFNVIADNDALTSLAGLESLEFIDEGLEIANNARLTSLAGLDKLETIDGTLNISNNPQLTTLDAAPNLSAINFDLNVDTNASLTSLEGLNGLARVGQQLRIVNNPALTTLAGLTSLQTVASDMTVTNNQVLTTLEGLETISNYDVSNFVTVSFNPVLDCAALSLPFTVDLSTGNLTSCRTGDMARICEGDYSVTQQVAELTALADCEEITGSLTIGADPFQPEDGITSLV
ncbi:MAG: Ig-like domain-containing protein, partial [Deinococcota bacterium]